jgi:glycosyltransferase involved in cell wall biosynthesis
MLNSSEKNVISVSLGVAMIVKDSSETIERAIDSVKEISNQIVVVDTGSNDNTPVICSTFGTDLHFFKWNGNFSEARNYSLGLIYTDWILALDADEEFDVASFKKYKGYLSEPKTGGLNLIIENYLAGESGIKSRHRYTRLFRNHKAIRYEGTVHEQIAPSIDALGLDIIETEIVIRHYGYNKISREKIQRNKELILTELKNKPDDPWLKYHLAESEFTDSNFLTASELFQTIVESEMLSETQKEMSRLRLAQIAISKENYLDTMKWADFKSADPDHEGLRQFIICSSYLLNKDFAKVASILENDAIWSSSLVDKSLLMKLKNMLSEII